MIEMCNFIFHNDGNQGDRIFENILKFSHLLSKRSNKALNMNSIQAFLHFFIEMSYFAPINDRHQDGKIFQNI